MAIRELYNDTITSQSRLELEQFSNWMNDTHGGFATVIGGWAVWSYYDNGFGSRDIDLIFPNEEWKENIMMKLYFPHHDIKLYKLGDPIFGEDHYGKMIIRPDGSQEIIFFDMISADSVRDDDEQLGVTVDWNWVYDTQIEKPLGNSTINVPEIELLIPLKIIGCLSRIRSLKKVNDPDYLRSKIWKDCYDVANLTNHVSVTKAKIATHMEKTNLTRKLIEEFFEAYDTRQDVLGETNSTLEKIKNTLSFWKF